MKKILLIAICVILLISCNKDKSETIYGTTINIHTDISFRNFAVEDLLNETTINHYYIDSMKLYYQFNDGITEVYNENMASPRNIMFITEKAPYRLRIFTNVNIENIISDSAGIKTGESLSYLKLNNFDTDTIKNRWHISKHSTIVSEIWYNGEHIPNHQHGFEIVK